MKLVKNIEMFKTLSFIIITLAFSIVCYLINLSFIQNVAVTIFVAKTAATLLFWKFRVAFALIGLAILFATGCLDVEHFIEFSSLDVVIFLVGMMIIIGYLEEHGFFEYILNVLVRFSRGKPTRIYLTLMFSSFLFAAIVDEVTSILFITAIVLRVALASNLSPIPLMLMTVFATNIGSSATVVGNPIGVMVALRGNFSFIDFLYWSTPVAILSLLLTIAICSRYYREYLNSLKFEESETLSESNSREKQTLNFAIFAITLLILVLHSPIEHLLHLEKGIMLIVTSLFMAGLILLMETEKAKNIVVERVDWWTLLFFIALFASVGTLKYVGIIDILIEGFLKTGLKNFEFYLFFTYIGGFLTAVMDNVLAVATLIPIVEGFKKAGLNVLPYWWSMLYSGTYMGNLTPIGSTANIIAIGIVERTHKVSFKEWLKVGSIVSIPTLLIASAITYLRALYFV
ncbi:MAG: SLC13 family permease [Candidatus Methanomethylicia archaeon]